MKISAFFLIISILATTNLAGITSNPTMLKKRPQPKVLFVIAYKDYQPIEYNEPKNLLTLAGIHVVTASNKSGTATSQDFSRTPVDITIKEVNPADYDAIIFIGGGGALLHLDKKISYKLINAAYKDEKIIGAICISSRILAHSGILAGKKATGWNDDNKLAGILKKHGATYIPKSVVIDGNIITGEGPDTATAFARALITLLRGHYKYAD